MQRNDCVSPPILATRETDVTNNADEPSSRHEGPKRMAPDLVKFGNELVVILDVTHLAFGISILFQRPIRRGCHHKMNTIRGKSGHLSSVTQIQMVGGRD